MNEPVPYPEHEYVLDQFSQSEREVRRLRSVVAKLEREQSVSEDSPEAANVKALLDLWWKEVKGSDSRVAHGLESTRAPKVRAALRRRKKVDGGEDEAFDMCRRAILGVNLDDWASGRIKKSGGKPFNDIAEHILNTDGDIEKFAKLHDDQRTRLELVPESQEQHDRRILEQAVARVDSPPPDKGLLKARFEERVLGDRRCPWDRVVQALRDRGSEVVFYEAHGDTFKAQCPAHDDRDPSLSVKRKADGTLLVKCWAGCDTADVLSALGLVFSDLWECGSRDAFVSGTAGKDVLPSGVRRALDVLFEDEWRGVTERRAA